MRDCAHPTRLVVFLVAGLLTALWARPLSAVDLDFVEAYQKRNTHALLGYASTRTDDPLEPYLMMRVADPRDLSEGKLSPQVACALDRFAGVPPVEDARATALKAWARKGEWERFGAHIDRVPEWIAEQDTELRCAKIAFLRSGNRSADGLRSALFARITEFPPLCGAAFGGALASGEVTPDQVMTKLMHIGSLGRKGDADRLLDVFSGDLKGKTSGRNAGAQVLEVLDAARSDYRKGMKAFERHKHLFDAGTKRDVLIHVGIIGARTFERDAHGLIKSVDGYRRLLPPAVAEWRTKAALLAGAWSDVAASIESMASPLREEPPWRYWLARSLERIGRTDEARPVYEALSRQPGYYGILAAQRLGQKPPYLGRTFSQDPAALKGWEKGPETARALALYRVGLWVEAARELNILLRGADSATFYAAALYARDRGLLDRQISFAQRASDHIDLTLRYPLLYRKETSEAALRTGLSPELLWAVIRQESRFVPYAVSSAGAVGLMQVMPATAQQVSAKKGLSGKITREALVAPDVNISLGSAFLESMLRRYGGNYALAAAAYNAGPGRVDKWQRQLSGTDIERFIELIPFAETRDYTKQVLANYVLYAYVTGGDPISLSSLAAVNL
jgi:soluble lytic murein transglycosylase